MFRLKDLVSVLLIKLTRSLPLTAALCDTGIVQPEFEME